MWLCFVLLQVCVTALSSVTCGGCDVLVRVMQSFVAAEQKNIPMYSLCIAAVAAFSVRVQLCMLGNGFVMHGVCFYLCFCGVFAGSRWMKVRGREWMHGRSSENRCSFLPACGKADR